MEHRVSRELKESKAHKELTVLKDFKVFKVLVLKACKVFKALMVHKDSKVFKVLALKDRKGSRE